MNEALGGGDGTQQGLDGDGLTLVDDGSIVGVEDEDEEEGLDGEACFDGVAGCLRLMLALWRATDLWEATNSLPPCGN